MSFDGILKNVQKAAKEDPHSRAYKAGDIEITSGVPYGILSGIPRLDLNIGRPGLPAGKVVEFYGFEMCGKTTAALHVLAQAQKAGGGGMYIDAEYSWDEDRAIDLGIDPDVNFMLSEVDTIEATFRQMDAAIQSVMDTDFGPFVIIVDSITGVCNEHELGKEYGEVARVGEDARAIRNGMRKIMKDISKSNVLVIFINHAISKIGAMQYAKQSDSSGGKAIKFYATLRCNFNSAGNIQTEKDSVKKQKKRLGQKVNIKIDKLKKSRLEFPEIKEVALMGVNGFDLEMELFEAGKESGLIERVNTQT